VDSQTTNEAKKINSENVDTSKKYISSKPNKEEIQKEIRHS